jgi:hypothetical protein
MPQRIVIDELKNILAGTGIKISEQFDKVIDEETVSGLQIYVDVASDIVDGLDSSLLSATRLKNIELYLSAHFAELSSGIVISDKDGESQLKVSIKNDFNLYLTHFGQMACVLDSTGELQRMSGKTKFLFRGD